MHPTDTTTPRSNPFFTPHCVAFASLLWLSVAPPIDAQWAHVGSAFDISQAADCNQTPTVAATHDGRFVVAWDRVVSDTIMGRVYAADGTPIGAETTLVSSTSARLPDVAMASDGSFAMTWEGSLSSIRARRFSSTGVGLGTELIVDTAALTLGQPRVASAADGRFVVVWSDTDGGGQSIQARRYAADGTPLAAAFEVRRQAGATPSRPRIDMQSNGDFTVTWMEVASGNLDVLARRYDAAGTPSGAAFVVHASTAAGQLFPDIATSESGELSVVWSGSLPSSTSSDAVETRLSAAGTRISELRIGDATLSEVGPQVTLSNDGGTRFAAFLQRPFGTMQAEQAIRLAAAEQTNQPFLGALPEPVEFAIALDDRERGIVIWSDQTGSCGSIHGQRVQNYRLLAAGTRQDRVHSVSTRDAWKQYVYFPSTSPATVTFTLTLPAAVPRDADLYAAFSDFPTTTDFACRSFNGGGVTEVCTLDTNGRPILIGVYGFDLGGIDFQLDVSETAGIFFDGFETGDLSAW